MSDSHGEHFIVPVKYYVITIIVLLILTIFTVLVALVDFGSFNIVIALGIAILKATIVLCVFMGLYWDEAFNRVVAIGSILFFVLFVVILLLDVGTRNDVYPNERDNYKINSPVKVVKEYSSHHAYDKAHGNDKHHDADDASH